MTREEVIARMRTAEPRATAGPWPEPEQRDGIGFWDIVDGEDNDSIASVLDWVDAAFIVATVNYVASGRARRTGGHQRYASKHEPREGEHMTAFAWLIEAPGAHYLSARRLGRDEFFWTNDHEAAIRFFSEQQADQVMMAVRELNPDLFAFARNLKDPRPVEHSWLPAAGQDLSEVFQDGSTHKIVPTLPELEGVKAALRQAGERFREYEASHAAKGSIDGDAKARRNAEMAEVCEAALQALEAKDV